MTNKELGLLGATSTVLLNLLTRLNGHNDPQLTALWKGLAAAHNACFEHRPQQECDAAMLPFVEGEQEHFTELRAAQIAALKAQLEQLEQMDAQGGKIHISAPSRTVN